VLLYRRITSIGTITRQSMDRDLLTTLAVIVTGRCISARPAPLTFRGAFNFSVGFLFGLGAASRIGVYDYLGYYDICYIGDEVKDPGRTIPRSIIISVVCSGNYLPCDQSFYYPELYLERVRARGGPPRIWFRGFCSNGKDYGPKIATAFTAMVALDSVRFSLRPTAWLLANPLCSGAGRLLLQSFRPAAPTKHFPYVALIVIGVISIICSSSRLNVVIDALITTRILVNSSGQIFALIL